MWTRLRERYGDIFRLGLGGCTVVILCHPDHAYHVLVDAAERYTDKGGASGFRETVLGLTGGGLSTMDAQDDVWRERRRMLRPLFSHDTLGPLTATLERIVDDRLVAPFASTGEIDVLPPVASTVLQSLAFQLFGVQLDERSGKRVERGLDAITSYMWPGMLAARWPRVLPFPGRGRQRRELAAVERVIAGLAARRMPGGGGDLLALLQLEPDADAVQPVRDEAASMLLGSQPLAMSLAWAFRLLAEHPEVQRRIVEELGDDASLAPRIPSLRFLRSVVKEALRLCPPTYWIQRRAASDDVVAGVRIPAGSLVILQLHQIHRHPGVWPDPDAFDPERFRRSASERGRNAWMPFGVGWRGCIAHEYSILQMELAIGRVLQRVALEPAGRRPVLEATLNLRPRGPVRVRATPRG